MAIAVGATSKGRSSSASSQATSAVTTQASGSTFVVGAVWDTTTFSSISDSKGNTYTLLNTELAWGTGSARARLYYSANAVGGASHTATVTLNASAPIMVSFLEITGAEAASLDQSNRAEDTASPYDSPSITTTQADELLASFIPTDSGSNPATFAESTGFTIQTAATETNGASFYTAAMGTRIVSSTGTYNSSWTNTGAGRAGVFIASFKQAAAVASILPSNLTQLVAINRAANF